MKKVLFILLSIIMCVAVCACDSGSSTTEDTTISSSEDAIYAVKSDTFTEQRICSGLGYKFFKTPNYGSCYATQNSDGSWDVTLKGNMWGYYNETKTDLDLCGFELNATVSKDGKVTFDSVEKVD